MTAVAKLLPFIVFSTVLLRQTAFSATAWIFSEGTLSSPTHNVKYEQYSSLSATHAGGIVVLHGTGGLRSNNMNFVALSRLLAGEGYVVLIPHYLDATGGSSSGTGKDMPAWLQVVDSAVAHLKLQDGVDAVDVALFGYSLGASVALAAASRGVPLRAVISWSGSLPDRYFYSFKSLPPVLILHGSSDTVIPVRDAEQLSLLCRARGLPYRIKIYPGEGHAFRSEATGDAELQIVQFLRSNMTDSHPNK